ncbi:GMC family oxidoreductase [Pigmentiphaga soli]|uniref:GMC family oxidoreductase n=1 Tax=Pigmentiphaga soli TaxID=1007095 RepID=A0ABP8GLV3_9BURK
MAIQRKPVDIVIVGAGVAGTIIAKELLDAGLQVLQLERGRMVDPNEDFAMPFAHDELKFTVHSDLGQDLSRETVTFRNTIDEIALPMRQMGSFKPAECVGGAGILWNGQTWRFLPWDFEVRSRAEQRYGAGCLPEDCTSQDWGLTYQELEPHYERFEQVYGVGGKAGNLNGAIVPGGNPFEGPRASEYPNPPTRPTLSGALFTEAAQSLGYTPFTTPSAAMTRDYVNPYGMSLNRCVKGGFCSQFGCANGAKASPLTTVLPALLRHRHYELRPHSNVVRINLDPSGTRATGVTYLDATAKLVEQPAELVILCSYTLNNTRLMLLSGIGQPYDPVSGTGVIGKNYSYQPVGTVNLFFEDRSFNRFMGGGAQAQVIDDFNGDNFDHTGLGFIGGAYISANNGGALPIRSRPVPEGTPRWGRAWKKAVSRYYDRSFTINAHGGCQSYRGNYLDLDPTYKDAFGLPLLRMTFDWRDNERKMSAYTTARAAEIARAIGPDHLKASPVKGKYSNVHYENTHNNGGVIVGGDPRSSALNKYLQSWDVPNVFVVGASAFPQNSANNPTGTVGALAYWTAEAITTLYLDRQDALVDA